MANFFNQPGGPAGYGRGAPYGFPGANVPTYSLAQAEHPMADNALQSFGWNQPLHPPPGMGMTYPAPALQRWEQPSVPAAPASPCMSSISSLRANLIDFYRHHAPEHLEQNFVDGLLRTFQGREAELDHLLRARYGSGLFQRQRPCHMGYQSHGQHMRPIPPTNLGNFAASSSEQVGLRMASASTAPFGRQTAVGVRRAQGRAQAGRDPNRDPNRTAQNSQSDFKEGRWATPQVQAQSSNRPSSSQESWQDEVVGSGLQVSEETAKAIMGISAMKRRNDLMQCMIW